MANIPPVLSRRYLAHISHSGDVPTLSEFARRHCPHVDFEASQDYSPEFYQCYREYLASPLAKRMDPESFARSGISLPKFLQRAKNPESEKKSVISREYADTVARLVQQYEENNRTPPKYWTANQKELFKRFLKISCEQLRNPTFEQAKNFKLAQVHYASAASVTSFARRKAKEFQRALKSRGVGLDDPYTRNRADHSQLERALYLFEQVYADKTPEEAQTALRNLPHEDLVVLLKFLEHLCYELHHGDAGKLDSGTLPLEQLLAQASSHVESRFLESGAGIYHLLDESAQQQPTMTLSSTDRALAYGWESLSDLDKEHVLRSCERNPARLVGMLERSRVRVQHSHLGPCPNIPLREEMCAFANSVLR